MKRRIRSGMHFSISILGSTVLGSMSFLSTVLSGVLLLYSVSKAAIPGVELNAGVPSLSGSQRGAKPGQYTQSELKVALAEELATKADASTPDALGVRGQLTQVYSAVLTGVFSNEVQKTYDALVTEPWFFGNLVNQSSAVKRLRALDFNSTDTKLKRQPRDFISEFNAIQVARELRERPQNTRIPLLEQKMKRSEIPRLSHPEVIYLLTAFSESDQWNAYLVLEPQVFTRLDDFDDDSIGKWINQISPNIFIDMISKVRRDIDLQRLISFRYLNRESQNKWLRYLDGKRCDAGEILSAFQSEPWVDLGIAEDLLSHAANCRLSFRALTDLHETLRKKLLLPKYVETFDATFEALSQERVRSYATQFASIHQFTSDPQKVSQGLDLFLAKNPPQASSELAEFLSKIPTTPVQVKSEKELLPLRDRLREFTKDEWTAFDLYHMHVPYNLVLLMKALDSPTDTCNPTEIGLIQSHVMRVLNASQIHDIAVNPSKPKLAPPQSRGVSVEMIKKFFLDQATKLGGPRLKPGE